MCWLCGRDFGVGWIAIGSANMADDRDAAVGNIRRHWSGKV